MDRGLCKIEWHVSSGDELLHSEVYPVIYIICVLLHCFWKNKIEVYIHVISRRGDSPFVL